MSDVFIHRTTPASDEEKAEARKRLRGVLPHLFIAANMAQLEVPGGAVGLAIVAKAPTGGGRITCQFEAAGFLSDLEALIGPLLTKDDDGEH